MAAKASVWTFILATVDLVVICWRSAGHTLPTTLPSRYLRRMPGSGVSLTEWSVGRHCTQRCTRLGNWWSLQSFWSLGLLRSEAQARWRGPGPKVSPPATEHI